MKGKVLDASAAFEEVKAAQRPTRMIDIDRFFGSLEEANLLAAMKRKEMLRLREAITMTVRMLCEMEYAKQQGDEQEMSRIAYESMIIFDEEE